MDLKEIKKITLFARKAGLKALAIDGLTIEFAEVAIQAPVKRIRTASKEDKLPEPIPGPSLDEINQYIYTDQDSA